MTDDVLRKYPMNRKQSGSGTVVKALAIFVYVLLHRVQFLAWLRNSELPNIAGFAVKRDTFVRAQTSIRGYRRVRVFEHPETGVKLYIQYRPAVPWLPPAKVTVVPKRREGLSRRALEAIAAAFEKVRMLRAELPVDFRFGSGVNRDYILRHALFGRSKEKRENPHSTLWFGTRRSEIFGRAYDDPDGSGYRVEPQANSEFLRRHGILSVADLSRLPDLLFPRHVCFFEVDWERLTAHISRNYPSPEQIIAQCHERAASLSRVLEYLRDELGLPNRRRFLAPLPVNQSIKEAANKWAEEWEQWRG